MKKLLFTLSLTSIIFWSCSNEQKSSAAADTTGTSEIKDTAKIDHVATADPNNAQTSLDWNGSYKGITPCADCEGIETEVTLNQDMTFVIKTKYKGKSDQVYEEKGKFKWDNTGSKITLETPDHPKLFFVGENTLTQLDIDGNKVTGALADSYVLKK